GRPEDRLGRAVAGDQDQQPPEREHARQRENRNGADEDPRDDVRAEQDVAAREPIGKYTTEEQHRDMRQGEPEPDQGEGRRAVRDFEGLPADRDVPDPVSEQRDRARRPEQAEVTAGEWRKEAAQLVSRRTLVGVACGSRSGLTATRGGSVAGV